MKKTILILTIAGALVVNMTSCRKEGMRKSRKPIAETINVQMKVNEAYTFVLPKNMRDDSYYFIEQASHSSISALGKNANGDRIYQYTPALNYYGKDRVVVSNAEVEYQAQGSCWNPHPADAPKGNCDGKGGEEDHYIVTINFDVANRQITSNNTK
ncbi:MAG: hypothetical protein IAF38_15175 [Bacteroidia bacterium]|nr:hypothetical protein [Bacteroidia bacterium]